MVGKCQPYRDVATTGMTYYNPLRRRRTSTSSRCGDLAEQPRRKIDQIVPPVRPHVSAFALVEGVRDLALVEQLVEALVRCEQRVLVPAVDVELLQLFVGCRSV